MDSDHKKYFCGHCNAPVSKTLFFKHKKLFYDPNLKVWRSKRIPPAINVEDEFVLSNDTASGSTSYQPPENDMDYSGCEDTGEYSSLGEM